MAQIGVKVIIVPVEGRFQEARLMDMNHDLTLSGWATDSNDPDSFFRPLLSCAAIASQTNYAHWCNREFDDVLQKALTSQQLASRIDAYKEAQRILAVNCRCCRWPPPAFAGLSLRYERPGAEPVWQRLLQASRGKEEEVKKP
jgi:cationic peptide transport system substrate-binding protein